MHALASQSIEGHRELELPVCDQPTNAWLSAWRQARDALATLAIRRTAVLSTSM
jgi:hypothetical protein